MEMIRFLAGIVVIRKDDQIEIQAYDQIGC